MKYSEFKTEVEKIGLHIGVYESHIDVVDKRGNTVGSIDKTFEMGIDTEYEDFEKLPQEKRVIIFDALYKLAKTPLAEREEEKRYRLRIVANLGFMDDQRFLNLNIEREDYFICSARQSEWVKTIFTESEISQMDITGFEKVEVTE